MIYLLKKFIKKEEKMNKLKVLILFAVGFFLSGSNIFAQNKVIEKNGQLLITFSNGVEIEFLKEGNNIKGIGSITCDGVKIRNSIYSMRPLISTLKIKGQYKGCEYDSWYEKDGGIIIKSKLIPKEENFQKDVLEWRFYPISTKVYKKAYKGFSYNYYFKSNNEDKAQRLLDRTSWEIDGIADNLVIREIPAYGDVKNFPITLKEGFNIAPFQRFFKEYKFNFQTSPSGTLFIYYQYPVSMESFISKDVGVSVLNYFDLIDINLKEEFEIPLKYVLFSSEAKGLKGLSLEDEYCYIDEYVTRQQYAYFGAKAPGVGIPWITNCSYENRDAIKNWASDGFQGIYFLTSTGMNFKINDSDAGRFITVPYQNWCGIWYFGIGPFYGGEDMFKDYCQEAEKYGMKVLDWVPSGYLGGRSPIVMKHPDWVGDYDDAYLRKYAEYYQRTTPLMIMDADSPYPDIFLKRFKQIRERTGLSGLFLDSYQVGHVGASKVYKEGGYVVNVERLARRDGALCKEGYFLSPEGQGPLGSPFWPVKLFDGKDYQRRYKWFFLQSYYLSDKIDKNYWYMNLANGTGVGISSYHLWGRKENILSKEMINWIIRANLDHKEVKDEMEWRHLIPDPENPEEPIGVEWRNSKNENIVVFSFGEFEYPTNEYQKITDITEGTQVKDISSGYLKTKQYHTYRIEK